MQIDAVAKLASSSTGRTPAQPQSKPATASFSTVAAQPAAASSSAAPARSAPAPARIQSSVSSSQVESMAASYSTRVAGKSYSASVEESGGTYVASTPNPPDISASGSSIASAESNLDMKLDTLA